MWHRTPSETRDLGRTRAGVAGVVVMVLLAAGLAIVGGVTPAGAGSSWGEGVASAPDVSGRLVTVAVSGSTGSNYFPPTTLRAHRQTCPGCGWQDLGTIGVEWAGTPSLSLAADGRLQVIGWSSDPPGGPEPGLRVLTESCPGCGWPVLTTVSDPSELLPFVGEPFAQQPPFEAAANLREGVAVATNPDGRRELFTSSSSGELWHTWEWCAGCEWAPWASLGAPAGDPFTGLSAPAAASNADGRLEVYARTASGRLVHSWQWCGGGCGWSAWTPADHLVAPAGSAPGLQRNADGRLEVFAAVDGVLQHSWQECPGCGWTPWVGVDGDPPMPASVPNPAIPTWVLPPAGPAATRNADGRLEVMLQVRVSIDHVWQVCAGCGWGPTVPLG